MPISISMIVVSSQLVVAVADRVLVSNDGRFCNMNCSSDGRCNVTEGVSPNNVRYATSKRPSSQSVQSCCAMSPFGTFETCRWILKRSAYGEDRKWSADRENGAFDPQRTSGLWNEQLEASPYQCTQLT